MPSPATVSLLAGGDVLDLTRRDFFRIGKGVAASAILAGLGLASTPRDAHAIIGIDDALLGAVVVAVASLGGFALYNQFSGNMGLQAVGASFGNYVSSAPNRTAAAAAAAQIAATYGLTTTQERFSTAADSIANGAGAFADAMAAAAETGRLALDGLVSGTGDLVGAFRELVAGWLASGSLLDEPSTVPSLTPIGTSGTGTLSFPVGIMTLESMRAAMNAPALPSGVTSGYLRLNKNWPNTSNNSDVGQMVVGAGLVTGAEMTNAQNYKLILRGSGQYQSKATHVLATHSLSASAWASYNYPSATYGDIASRGLILTPDLVGAVQLPAVDKPADVPDVIGAGWDSVPLATDMVISPTTGEVVSAGSVPLPTGIPTTAGDYAAALQGALAGVVTDAIALPLSLSVPVTVATPLGVESMPISQAISTETSLQLDYAPDIPITPVLPPVEVPEGPWTPAVSLPFAQVWPFNMIYTFIDTLGALGNAG